MTCIGEEGPCQLGVTIDCMRMGMSDPAGSEALAAQFPGLHALTIGLERITYLSVALPCRISSTRCVYNDIIQPLPHYTSKTNIRNPSLYLPRSTDCMCTHPHRHADVVSTPVRT
jgi:hypothetical protein